MTVLPLTCLFFCVGMALESFLNFKVELLFFVSCFALILNLIFLKSAKFFYPFFCFLFFAGGGLVYAHASFFERDSAEKIEAMLGENILLYGRLVNDPYQRQGKTFFLLDSVYMHVYYSGSFIQGKILVEDRASSAAYAFGQEVVLKGRLSRRFGYARFFKKRSGAYIFRIGRGGLLSRYIIKKRVFLKEAAFFVKHKADEYISRNMKPQDASILRAMLLGERFEVPARVKDSLIKTGVWHVLVVSGFHVALIVSMLWLVLKILRIPLKLRIYLTIAGLWFYCFLAGSAVSVERAVIMSSFFLAGFLLERKPHFYNTFALAAFVILIVSPLELFNIGFQLSFISVFFIIWLSPKLKTIFPPAFSCHIWSRWFVDYFCVALSAWLGTLPILLYYFGSFSWFAVLANILVVPLSMLIVSSGFAFLWLQMFFMPAARFISSSTSFFILLFLKISYCLSSLSFGYVSGVKISFPALAGFYAALAAFGLFLKRRNGRLKYHEMRMVDSKADAQEQKQEN